MNLKTLTTLFVIFISININAQAQNSNSINGVVKTENNIFLEGTLINLLNASNRALLKTTLTTKENTFNFTNLKAGNYIINIQIKGYKKYNASVVIIDSTLANSSIITINLLPTSTNDAERSEERRVGKEC